MYLYAFETLGIVDLMTKRNYECILSKEDGGRWRIFNKLFSKHRESIVRVHFRNIFVKTSNNYVLTFYRNKTQFWRVSNFFLNDYFWVLVTARQFHYWLLNFLKNCKIPKKLNQFKAHKKRRFFLTCFFFSCILENK